jgi:hypothetical protein
VVCACGYTVTTRRVSIWHCGEATVAPSLLNTMSACYGMLVPQLCSSTIPEEAGNQERLYGPPPSFKNVDRACVSPARACSLPYVSFGVFCLSPSVLMQLFWTSDFCSVFIFFSFASCKRLQLIVSIIKMHMEVV